MIKSLIKSVSELKSGCTRTGKKYIRKSSSECKIRLQSSSGNISLSSGSRSEFSQRKKDLIQHFGKDTIKILGTGSFGIVYLLVRDGRHKYVVKEMALPSDYHKQLVMREIQILDRLHKNCNPYLLCLESWKIKSEDTPTGKKKFVLTVFDYIENSEELYAYSKKSPIQSSDLKKIIKNLALGLNLIHSMGVVHRDIKAENILIEKDNLNTRYIDFGLACEEKDGDCIHNRVGTPLFISPDLMTTSAMKYTWEQLLAGDVWALGVTIVDIIDGEKVDSFYDILTGIGGEPNKIRPKVGKILNDVEMPSLLREMLRKMLEPDYRNRITPIHLLLDPYLTR